jgi:hypothetical protein
MRDFPMVWQDADTALKQFVIVEVNLGITFADSASCELSTRDRLRNRQLAKRAYDSAVKWLPKVSFTRIETKAYYTKLHKLRLALNRLGDPIQGSISGDL